MYRVWGPNTVFIVELPLKLSITTDERYHRAPNARNVRPLMRDHKMVIKSKMFGPHHMNAVQQNGKRLQQHVYHFSYSKPDYQVCMARFNWKFGLL